MLRSRLFMVMLAALLIAQSALGMALHRCHEGMPPMAAREAVAVNMNSDDVKPCHDHAGMHNVDQKGSPADGSRGAAPHGLCTCAIAHCAPGLVSHFELAPAPVHTTTMPLYQFVVVTAPPEMLLRPPIVLS
jgi:hypothetical protein